MESVEILERARQAGLKMTVVGNFIEMEGQPSPEVIAIVEEIRQHKVEIMALLEKPELVEGQPPEWHAEEIARLVQIEGQAIFWSTLFNEVVAFIKDESYKTLIPNGIAIYTIAEIEKLFGNGSCLSKETLLRIHKEKKLLRASLVDYQGNNKQCHPKPGGGD